jgi:5-methylcytosine-specific restriction protein A
MSVWSPATRADIVRATEEYDRLGQDVILAQYVFGRPTAYSLVYNGRSYDSEAILGVAYLSATARTTSGGIYGAAVIRNLGFDVRNVRDKP